MQGLLDYLGGATDLSGLDPSKLGLLQFLQAAGAQGGAPTPPAAPGAAPPQMGLLSSLMGRTPLAPPQPDDTEADVPAAGAKPVSAALPVPPGAMPGAPVVPAAAPAPAPSPDTGGSGGLLAGADGFLDKLGGIYGAGGKGDGLINMGLALMAPGSHAENMMKAAALTQQSAQLAQQSQLKAVNVQSRVAMLKAAGKSDAEASAIANSDGAFSAFVSKNKPQPLVNAGNGNIYDPQTKTWIKTPDDGSANTKYTYMKQADGSIVALNPTDPTDVKIVAQGGSSASPDLVNSLASRAIAGDSTWKTGLARQSGLITAVEEEVAKRGKATDTGSNAETILQARANQSGRVKEQGTLGTATANNTLYGNAAQATMDTAIQASRDVPRGTWLPVNKILQAGQTAMSDPKLAKFVAANNTLVNDYAKAVTPAGVPTDSQRHHAEDMLNTAQSPEAYEAVVRMMQNEIANTHRAIEYTKAQLRSGHSEPTPPLQSVPGGPGSTSGSIFSALGGGAPAAPAAPGAPAPAPGAMPQPAPAQTASGVKLPSWRIIP